MSETTKGGFQMRSSQDDLLPMYLYIYVSYIQLHTYIWEFPKIGVPPNRWFIMENSIKMDDLGVPLFPETPISVSTRFPSDQTPCRSVFMSFGAAPKPLKPPAASRPSKADWHNTSFLQTKKYELKCGNLKIQTTSRW